MPIPFIPPPQASGALAGGLAAGAQAGGQILEGRIKREQIAAEMQAQMARLGVQRAQIAQQAEIAKMELAAKKEIAQQDAMRRQHEMAIEQAYKDAQIGLKTRELDTAEAAMQMQAQQAAQAAVSRQQVAEAIAGGMKPMEAMARFGGGLSDQTFRAVAGMADEGEGPESFLGKVHDVPGLGHVVRTGKESGRFVPKESQSEQVWDRTIFSTRLNSLHREAAELRKKLTDPMVFEQDLVKTRIEEVEKEIRRMEREGQQWKPAAEEDEEDVGAEAEAGVEAGGSIGTAFDQWKAGRK